MINSFEISDFFKSLNREYFDLSFYDTPLNYIDKINFPCDILTNYQFNDIYVISFDNFNFISFLTTDDNQLMVVSYKEHTYSFFKPLTINKFEKIVDSFVADFNVPKLTDLSLINNYFFDKLELIHSSVLELDFVNSLLQQDSDYSLILDSSNKCFNRSHRINYLQSKSLDFKNNLEETSRIAELEKEIERLKKQREKKFFEYKKDIGLEYLLSDTLSFQHNHFSLLKNKKETVLNLNNKYGFNNNTIKRLFKI